MLSFEYRTVNNVLIQPCFTTVCSPIIVLLLSINATKKKQKCDRQHLQITPTVVLSESVLAHPLISRGKAPLVKLLTSYNLSFVNEGCTI